MSSVSSPQSSGSGNVIPDQLLMARIRSGDERALTMLYDRYSQIVYSVALRVLGDTSQAEDILQEIFMQIWRKPHSFDAGRGSLAAWLSVIARHRAIDQLRRRRPESDIEDVVLPVNMHIEQITDRNLVLGRVRNAVEGLPAEQRRPLEMAFFQGLTHAEIAAQTGEPLGTVKTRIRSALITLRKVFAA